MGRTASFSRVGSESGLWPELWLAMLATALAGLTFVALWLRGGRGGGFAFMAAFLLASIGAYAGSVLGGRADPRRGLIIILAGAAAMRLALLFVEPHLSNDVLRYVWDGRVQAHGINPYRYVPHAPELAALRDEAIWPHINRADYAVTIYPPAAQMIFLVITRFGESVLAMKIGLLAFEAATIGLLIALLLRQGARVTWLAAYAWHPLPIWEIAGNGHIDAAMVALQMSGLLLFVKRRVLLAAVATTLAALVKPIAIVALPVFWRPWNWRMPLVVALTITLFYLPYMSVGWGVLGFLPTYLHEEGLTSGNGIRLLTLVQQVVGLIPFGQRLYVIAALFVLATMAVAACRRSDRSDAAMISWLRWMLVAYLILSSPSYPWYFVVLVPFLALSPSATVWVLTTCCALLYYSGPNEVLLPGYELRVTVFNFVTLAALAYDLWRAQPHSTGLPLEKRHEH